MRVLGVSAVADGDERHDALPDRCAAVPERPDVTKSNTRDDYGDRPAEPIPFVSLCTYRDGDGDGAPSVCPAESFAVLSNLPAPSPSVRLAQLFAAQSAPRAAPSSPAADQPSALRTPAPFLPQFKKAGPDRFYIEPVSRSTLPRFGSHTRRTDGA